MLTRYLKTLCLLVLLLLSGCTYGPESAIVVLDNAVAQPDSHTLAIAVGYKKIQVPTGFLNTFPNGGVLKIVYREARVYRADIDTGSIVLAARIPNYAGIPQPKSVWIDGWKNGDIYFSLRGYGGGRRHGDDFSDKRILNYRLSRLGELEQLEKHPPGLAQQKNSGPVGRSPFLRLSRGHLTIDIGVDTPVLGTAPKVILSLDPHTGQPYFRGQEQVQNNRAD